MNQRTKETQSNAGINSALQGGGGRRSQRFKVGMFVPMHFVMRGLRVLGAWSLSAKNRLVLAEYQQYTPLLSITRVKLLHHQMQHLEMVFIAP